MASTDYATNGASGQNNDLNNEDTHNSAMQKIRTAGSVSIPPDVFEKLYLTPQDAAVKGGLRKTLGNPTPLGLAGFLLSLTPLSCDLMNWRAAGTGNGSSDIPVYMFFGGILMNIAAIFELILGNTYIATVFGTFGCFWLSYGSILDPTFSAYGNYDPGNPAKGLDTVPFNAALGFFLLFMGLLCLIYLIGALRTNVVLVLILFPLPFAFGLLAATFWYTAESYDTGSASLAVYANTLKVTAGAFTFATDMFGWYLFAALILAALDFPISLPVGDLSTKIKGASQKYSDRV